MFGSALILKRDSGAPAILPEVSSGTRFRVPLLHSAAPLWSGCEDTAGPEHWSADREAGGVKGPWPQACPRRRHVICLGDKLFPPSGRALDLSFTEPTIEISVRGALQMLPDIM